MFNYRNLGHFFGTVVHDIGVASKFLNAHEAEIDKGLEVGATVISLVDPAFAPVAQVVARAGEALVGEALAAISKLDAAANHPVNIELDSAAILELKQLLNDVRNIKGFGAVPPAHLQ